MTSHAIQNVVSWYETIQDQLARLKAECRPEGDTEAYETIREEIQDSPLAVEVRSGWHSLGSAGEPEEFQILLSTGGPALRIVGKLDLLNCPEHSRLQWQDWGTPWMDCSFADSATLDAWAAQFWFGE
jgi:hypothetical protein